jgi:hypothetical protein
MPSGATLGGTDWASDSSEQPLEAISFGYRFATPLQFVLADPSTTAQCPGSLSDPRAAAGYFCVYEQYTDGVGLHRMARDPEDPAYATTGHTGVVVYLINGATTSVGTWAATAA